MKLPSPSRERTQDTFLGRESTVRPGLGDYDDARSIERHTREVHEDVLKREGCAPDRAREIAADSAEQQARLLDRMRGETGPRVVGRHRSFRVEPPEESARPADSLLGAFLRTLGGSS